jgi:2-polyprenyl-3-methyl-5-hydroxy-6-metoxy-1,4-benzoquinol methylase
MTTYEMSPCPACRSADSRVLANQDEIKRELETLWEFHLKRMKAGAPVDQLFDRAIFSQKPPLHVVECIQCGTVYRNPREREEDVVETYQAEEPSAQALDSLFEQQLEFYRPRAVRLTALHGGTGSVLEVGSYVGGFLKAAREQGWRARGIDVNASANEYARTHGCDVAESPLDDYQTSEQFDVMALWNCFDQLPDPHDALTHAASLTRIGGLLALRVPNGAFYAALRGVKPIITPFLAWNNIASFPYRHGFTKKSLELMIRQHGFEVVETVADTLVPIAGPWTKRWARLEEGFLKATMRLLLPARVSPWLEVYARRSAH